jgi:energy-coupling factor transport system ATP-binding protein
MVALKASEDAIYLKDFYFSYNHRPYIFRKNKFTKADGDNLELKVSKLKFPRGKVIGVVGKNGTGKSTFLRCVCGLEKDCGGTIEIDGQVYKGNSRIGLSYMVMQDVNHQLFTDSVEAEVLLSMKDKDEKRCREILEELGLFTYKDTHPMALSGGQKQRVAIASAIAAGAQLFLFDEPTSGLDYDHMMKVGRLLKELADSGKTVLVSTHDPELIEQCCDFELYIEHGRVLSFGEIEDRTAKRGEKVTICVNT